MKVTVELDMTSEADCQALLRLLPGAAPAHAHLTRADFEPAEKEPPDLAKVVERGKAMTEASKALGTVVKDPVKLTPSQKAKVAAKARWDKHGAEKNASAAAPERQQPPVKKPPPPREAKPQDYSKAEEQQLSDYSLVPGAEMFLPGMEQQSRPYPDGRELLEGSFEQPGESQENVDLKELEHVAELERIARELGGLPADAEP